MKLGINRRILTIIRKTAPIFFLIVICMPFASTHFLFKIRQRSIHSAVKASQKTGEEENRLVLLKISLAEEKQPGVFERTDESEIKYKGNMYDITRFEVHRDFTLYWAVWDVEETELENKFKEIKSKGAGADSKNLNSEEVLRLFMNTLFFNPYESGDTIFVIHLAGKTRRWQSIGVNRTDTPPTPPPKV